MQALRYKPVAFYRLDDTTPFQDYSGYSRSGTMSGTESHGIALTADAAYSQRFYAANYGTFVAPVYTKTRESSAFSIAVTIYPIKRTTTGDQQVVSHGTNYDGITINGTIISFSTRYLTGTSATCSYDIEDYRKVDVVGVHSAAKNSLYIDGVLVAEVDVDEDQQASQYDISDTNFYAGPSSSNQRLLMNGLAFYNRALQQEEIKGLYQANNAFTVGSISAMYGGQDIFVSSKLRPAYLDTGWYQESDWNQGTFYGAVVDNNELTSQMDGGLTLGAVWLDSVNIYNGSTPSPIQSINLWWSGKNVTVEVSLDGATWTTAVERQNLSIISPGFDPTGKELHIRVTLTAGVDEAYLEYIEVNGYLDFFTISNNRQVSYLNTGISYKEATPSELRNDWGAYSGSAGSITIGPDTSGSPSAVRTYELWIKPDSDLTTSFGMSVANSYQNGASSTTSLKGGEWTLYHLVLSSNYTGNIIIPSGIQVGRVAVYPTALSASDIAAIATNYTGVSKTRYSASASLSVSEPATPALVYAHDWEIQTA
jgi:hypothetical protein